MQILIPVQSNSEFFPISDFYFPKPLIDMDGQPAIKVVVDGLSRFFPDAHFVFVVDRELETSFRFSSLVRNLQPHVNFSVVVKNLDTSGAVSSCLLAIDAVDSSDELIIANSDQVILHDLSSSVATFSKSNLDCGVLTFNSIHPRWSYVSTDDNGLIRFSAEKRVISNQAIAGFYYFKKADVFFKAAQSVILDEVTTQGKFFISSTLNKLILDGNRVGFVEIPSGCYHSFYDPSKLDQFRAALSVGFCSTRDVQVVIPAAGQGSRFANQGWLVPKPFIDLNGKPMIEHVLENVTPPLASPILIARTDHLESFLVSNLPQRFSSSQVVKLSDLTEGTACTVLKARKLIDLDKPLLIANSDQIVDFSVVDFIEDCLDRHLDGSILVFRDFTRNPKWSFALTDENGYVTRVAEKDPISDLATVGIYFFSRASWFINGALDMIVDQERINGEYYTCPVYNKMIAADAKVGVYEVARDDMHGLGTPEDFCDYIQRNNFQQSKHAPLK